MYMHLIQFMHLRNVDQSLAGSEAALGIMGEKTESGKARQCLSLEVFHPFGYGSRIRRSTHRSSRRVRSSL